MPVPVMRIAGSGDQAAAFPQCVACPGRIQLRRQSLDGGHARRHSTRLTSNPGLDLFARFSPDGRLIAFTGQYGGDEQVYVIPAEGGVPKQLTFYPAAGPARGSMGLRQSSVWLDAGRLGGVVQIGTRRLHADRLEALYGARGRRRGHRVAHARVGGGSILARRQTDRLFAALARLSQREALSGRLGE